MRYVAKNSEFHLSPSEVFRLVSHAPSPRDRLIVELFSLTGIRRAELRALRASDIDFDRRRLLIRGKGNKQRIVLIPSGIDARLRAYAADVDSTWLFPGLDGAMSLRNINYVVGRVGMLAGLQHPNPRYRFISPHLLRHSFARNWKRAGGSLESLKRLLGHSSLRTTMDLYGVESQEEMESNYRAMERALLG